MSVPVRRCGAIVVAYNRFHSTPASATGDAVVAEQSAPETDAEGAAPAQRRLALQRARSRPVQLAYRGGRRDRAGVAIGVATLGALLSAQWMPFGPVSTAHALGAMVLGVSVGAATGVALRSRWSMLLAPVVFAAVFELASIMHRPAGLGEFMVGRGFHGAVGVLPMVLGAAFGAAHTRRHRDGPAVLNGRARFGRHLRRTFAWISTGAMVALAVGLAWPASVAPIRDEEGNPVENSVAEKIRVEINGVDQGMFIKSTNARHPVLLFVHGGPGMPEYWLTQQYPTGLEDHFTVVWWEQRGAGLSYDPSLTADDMTVEQFVDDTLEVTQYLIDRFDQDRIYLMGHSWGSYVGIQAAAQAPELYHAYIGVGQLTHQIESEQIAYDYALDYYDRIGDQRMLRKLEAAPPGATIPLPDNYLKLRDEYMHKAGIGTTRDMTSVITGLFLPSFRSSEYTLMEKVNLWRGKIFSRKTSFGLWDTMLATDLRTTVPELAIPAYFFHGRHDYTCAYPLASNYSSVLVAPVKGFYTFEESAHSPMFEEPERTISILLNDVLNATNRFADNP
jgi:pimeloyl-ACP methyl ester carboxylesterase